MVFEMVESNYSHASMICMQGPFIKGPLKKDLIQIREGNRVSCAFLTWSVQHYINKLLSEIM